MESKLIIFEQPLKILSPLPEIPSSLGTLRVSKRMILSRKMILMESLLLMVFKIHVVS